MNWSGFVTCWINSNEMVRPKQAAEGLQKTERLAYLVHTDVNVVLPQIKPGIGGYACLEFFKRSLTHSPFVWLTFISMERVDLLFALVLCLLTDSMVMNHQKHKAKKKKKTTESKSWQSQHSWKSKTGRSQFSKTTNTRWHCVYIKLSKSEKAFGICLSLSSWTNMPRFSSVIAVKLVWTLSAFKPSTSIMEDQTLQASEIIICTTEWILFSVASAVLEKFLKKVKVACRGGAVDLWLEDLVLGQDIDFCWLAYVLHIQWSVVYRRSPLAFSVCGGCLKVGMFVCLFVLQTFLFSVLIGCWPYSINLRAVSPVQKAFILTNRHQSSTTNLYHRITLDSFFYEIWTLIV